MKQSGRARRMARNHKRNAQHARLSLVSLMDIFTILVFFLMLNASDVQVLDNHKSITLPESLADTPAKETLLIMVNNDNIVLQGQKVMAVEQALATNDDTLGPLNEELTYHASKRTADPAGVQDTASPTGNAITIMGDKSVPYALLKKIMTTCAQAGYTDVSLAVEQILDSQTPGAAQ
ncbi:ExbD/TolR family protein [Alteromonas sp. CYL-A6]|uniref:ExbD/TolR family protein n=1 Tax=Alteromonas nitratireducens TaxID=3390813 RepID=UPI0034B1DA39